MRKQDIKTMVIGCAVIAPSFLMFALSGMAALVFAFYGLVLIAVGTCTRVGRKALVKWYRSNKRFENYLSTLDK